jgi:excisionase family DNA binding protein
MEAERLFTLDGIAERLGLSLPTVRRMVARGELPIVYPTPRAPRVREQDFNDFVQGLARARLEPVA